MDRLEQYLQQQKPIAAPAPSPTDIGETEGATITTAPKPVVEVSAAPIYSQLNKGVHLETEQEVRAFVQQLQQLLKEINKNQRIRIR